MQRQIRKSNGPRPQETKDKISLAHKLSGHRPDPAVVDLAKARRVRWDGHQRDSIGILLVIYINSAKHRKVPFDLSRDVFEALINQECFYCGSPPKERTINSYKATMICNGIDRVDNSKGYLPENCVTACKTCNVAKARLGQQEFIDQCKKVAARHG